MRSNEIARLANVTTRTLRHYHAIGLMPEPKRTPNGYRTYEADDLARLLRIKRLSSLGFPLARIGEMLDQMDDPDRLVDATRALDELDQELAAGIDRLQEQRLVIQVLKREQLDPDMPVRFARAMKTLAGSDPDWEACARTEPDRVALTLAAHLFPDESLAEFENLVEALATRGLLEDLHSITQRCDALTADAGEEARASLAAEAVSLLSRVADCLDAESWLREYTQEELIIDEAERNALNDAQRDVADRITQGLERFIVSAHEGKSPLDPDVAS